MLRLKNNFAILSSALLLTASVVTAQDEAVEAVVPEEGVVVEVISGPPASKGRNRIAEIETLGFTLDSLYVVLKNSGVAAAAPIYGKAKGQLREAGSMISQKPASKESALAFSVCSTTAYAAIVQLEREINLVKVRQMNQTRDSLLSVLHTLHETINRIEGSRANRLSQDLEATKAKAAMIEGDLQATRGDLEATQAQAALLKEDLAAERERARQIMEDAQKRFNELQSEMIQVSRDARGTIITMADILFESGKANLTENLRINLAKIAGILMVYKDPKLVVEGHTDNVGTKEFNQKLSEDRAKGVMDFLIKEGVAEDRLTAIGSGFDKPIADNATREGRAKNRRVDLIIQDAEQMKEQGMAPAPAAPAAKPAEAVKSIEAAKPAVPAVSAPAVPAAPTTVPAAPAVSAPATPAVPPAPAVKPATPPAPAAPAPAKAPPIKKAN